MNHHLGRGYPPVASDPAVLNGLPPQQSPGRDLSPAELRLRSLAQTELSARQVQIAQQRAFEHRPAFKVPLGQRLQDPKAVPAPVLEAVVTTALGRLLPTQAHRLAEQALAAAEAVIMSQIRPRARSRARTVLLALYEATYSLIQERSQSIRAASYTFFTVLDVLPVATNLSVATCERATADLRAAGLIATWSSWTDAEFLDHQNGALVSRRTKQGVWLTVCLQPGTDRRMVTRVSELPLESPRDLALDRKTGRTAWRMREEVRESGKPREGKESIYSLLQWSLPEKSHQKSVKGNDALSYAELFSRADTPQDVIWNLGAVFTVPAQGRRPVIESAGTALARLFRDEQSVAQYCGFLWRAVEAQEQGQRAFEQLQGVMVGALGDMDELAIRRPGAWLRARLIAFGWL